MRLLFIHGAGGGTEDKVMADALATALVCPVDMPLLPEEDMSVLAWADAMTAALAGLGPGDVVAAHSFGASILLRVLTQGVSTPESTPAAVALLAMPNWGPQGWDVADYAIAGLVTSTPVWLHHCRDDDVVPFAHLALNSAQLPSARVREHPVGGHQFEGVAKAIARDLLDAS